MNRSLPETMLAIDPGEPVAAEALTPVSRPVPRPRADEVLVEVAAAGLNRPDIMQRKGHYPPPPGAPSIMGLELAGHVVEVGRDADPALLGKRVCALVAGGAHAEYAVAPAGQCLVLPDGLSLIEAAALPETLFTVWVNLFERAFAADGDWLLVHGGTSGIGTMAIKLARLFGLKVIVTCGSEEKCGAARRIGANHAINYRTTDFVEAVRVVTEGRGVDIVLDMVGGDYLPRNLACLAVEGRHSSIAVQRGSKAEIPVLEIMQKRLILTGSTLRARSTDFKAAVADELAQLIWPFLADGSLRPEIDAVFPLDRVGEAHRRMEDGDHVGKIVLTMKGEA